MAEDFKVRRDSSTNNVPTVGYNDGVDAQDVILFGACKVSETVTTDGAGKITLMYCPVSLTGATFVDTSGVRRGRNLNDEIIITSVDKATIYYAGSVSPIDKTLKVYYNQSRTAVVDGVEVLVTYYKRVPVSINENGEIVVKHKSTGTQDVNVKNSSIPVTASTNLPVAIKASDVSMKPKDKTSVMLQFEGEVASGATENILTLVTGNPAKDIYITNIVCYYDGTDTDTDPNVLFWFDYLNGSSESVGMMNLVVSPRIKGMTQVNLGDQGFKLPAGKSFRLRTGGSWVQNTVHVLACGWQYAS